MVEPEEDEEQSPKAKPRLDPVGEVRVEQAADLMRAGKYVRGRSAKAFAKEWGLTYQAARKYTALAYRRVMGEVGNPKYLRLKVHLTLARLMDSENGNAALGACKLTSELAGFAPPTRSELTGKGGGPLAMHVDFSALSDEELARIADGRQPSGPPRKG